MGLLTYITWHRRVEFKMDLSLSLTKKKKKKKKINLNFKILMKTGNIFYFLKLPYSDTDTLPVKKRICFY